MYMEVHVSPSFEASVCYFHMVNGFEYCIFVILCPLMKCFIDEKMEIEILN